MDQINNNILEREIERIGKEVAEKKAMPEHKELPEKELVKRALKPYLQATPSPATQKIQTQQNQILPDYLQDSSIELKEKVGKIISVAFKEGLEKGISYARAAGPFVLDAFHDALTDKLYEELKRRKII